MPEASLHLFFPSFFIFLSYYGLQLPQGSYPSAINSSLLPLNSSLFFAFIFLTLLQSGLWNFPVFVLITSASRSLPDFERGFRPACEVKTGTFDPRTTFCRPVIPRSSLITNSACSALSVSAFSTTAFPSWTSHDLSHAFQVMCHAPSTFLIGKAPCLWIRFKLS